MGKKILLVLAAALGIFALYVATQPTRCAVERSVKINAPASAIFPHVNDLKSFNAWNPFLKDLTNLEEKYSERTAGLGSIYAWKATGNVGTATITESVEPSKVVMQLSYEEPFQGGNVATFRLVPTGTGTEVFWGLDGEIHVVARVLGALRIFNLDKMMSTTVDSGLAELKAKVESATAK